MAERPPSGTQQIVAQIAATLGETEAAPQTQIRAIVRLCGTERALGWLQKTQEIEAAGGMLTEDGTRRRTPGGIYFRIVREGLRADNQQRLIAQIFWRAQPNGRSNPQNTPVTATTTWADRKGLIAEGSTQAGKVTTVKVTLIGTPGKIVEKPQFTLLMMHHTGRLPALPKGIPIPDAVPETTYVVYIGAKQWRSVAQALANNPDDSLIIEGTQFYDAEYSAITVFATNTTTKGLQQAKRQQQTEKQQSTA